MQAHFKIISFLVVLFGFGLATAHSAGSVASVRLGSLSATYDGTPKSATASTRPPRLDVTFTYNGSSTAPTAAGSYTVIGTVNDPNYTGSATGTLVIGKAAAKVVLSNLAVTYDTNPHAVTATTTPSGLTVDNTYNGSATVPTAAGSYAVVATINDPNYTGSAKGTLVISKGTATITLGNLAATYDGNSHAATATTTPSGLTVNIAYGRSTTPPTAAGSYALTATISDPNYQGSLPGTLVISKASATITLGSLAATYNGSAHPATAITSPAGLPVTFTYNGSARAVPVNIGSYAVIATINTANATGGPTTGTLIISTGTATVTLGNTTAVFSGRPISVTATTVPSRLAVTITYNGSPTPPTAVGTYPLIATVNNPNYTGGTTGTLTITPVPAVATTTSATLVGSASATLGGTVNPEGSATTVTFQYGTSTTYGTTTSGQAIGNGTASVASTASISSLTPQTIYHYRVVATSAGGVVNGRDATFKTLAVPTFATTPATPLLSASGTEVGFSVNPNGVATSVSFQYGTTTAYGSQTAAQNIGSGSAIVNVLAFLSGLQPNTTYHYQMVTVSSSGTFFGPDETFTTLAFDTTLVAKEGDTAAGTGGATYNGFGNAAVNTADGVAFAASLNLSASPSITSSTDLGIWADDSNGHLQLIAQEGAAAPDTSGATFSTLGDPIYNNNAGVAFGGQLRVMAGQVSSATALGIWSSSSGTLHLVARTGDQAPDCPTGATFTGFNAVGLSDTKTILIASISLANGVTKASNYGIWEGTTEGNLALVLRTGDIVSGKTIAGVTVFSNEPIVEGQTRNFASNTGDLSVLVTFTDKTTALLNVVNGVETIKAQIGDTAVGTNGATFATFDSPIINTADHIAFEATLTTGVGGITTSNNTGIWAHVVNDTRTLVAQTGNPAPDTAGTFTVLSDPVNNDNNAVAFAAASQVGNTTTTGIWCNSSGAVHLVTQVGTQAPGCLTGVTFSGFTTIALPNAGGSTNQGGVIFLGTLTGTGVSSANNMGIWIVDNTGTLQLVVRTGDVLIGKTLSTLDFLPFSSVVDGQTRSFAKNGDLAYLATFSDKSTAIFNVVFP